MIVFTLLLLFAFTMIVPTGHAVADEDLAILAIDWAEDVVVSSFEAVLEAERLGANVAGLIVRLKGAGDLLAEAKTSLNNGDFDKAHELVDQTVDIANGVKDEAAYLRVSALSHRELVFTVSLIGLVVGVPAFLVFMFALWRWFKSFYIRKLLSLRPEAAQNVEA